MSTSHFLSVVLLATLVLNARASFYFTWNAPGAVNVGQNYTVGVQAYFTPNYYGDPYATLGLYRNGSQVGGGGTGPYGSATASNSFTDNSPQTVGYSAEIYSYYGESDWSSHSVTVNGAPANNPPSAWVTVDGWSHGATVTRPYGGSVSVTVRYKASDPDNNLARIRPQVWHPSGYLNNNGGNFIGQSGGYGEVAWTVNLNENGNWHFWTDAEDTNNVFVNSGAWTAGFRLTVVEGAPPNTPPTVVLHSPSAQTIYLNQALTITSQATDPDNNIAHHNLDIQRPDGSWNWQGGFANGHPYTGGYNGSPGNSNRSASFTFNQLGTWYVRSAAADSSGWYHSATVAINVINVPDTTPPNPPANLQISNPSSSGFTASWTVPSGEAVTGYRVRLNSGGFTEIGNVLSHNFTGLTANTSYTVEVQARDAAGNWSGSASYGVTTRSNTGGTSSGIGQTVWLDTNGDGIRDKVTGSNSPTFLHYIDAWTTTQLSYYNAPVNSWLNLFNNFFGGTSYDNYSRMWEPPGGFSVGYVTQFWVAFQLETEADRPQKIYVDMSRQPDINPSRWSLLLSLPGFATGGWHAVVYAINSPLSHYAGAQYFLVEEGKPISSVQFMDSSGGALTGSVAVNGTTNLFLPANNQVTLKLFNTSGGIVESAHQVVWQIRDAIGNVLRQGLGLNVDLDNLNFLQIAQIVVILDNAPPKSLNLRAISIQRVRSDQIPGIPGSFLNALPDLNLVHVAPRTDNLVYIKVETAGVEAGQSSPRDLLGVRSNAVQSILGSSPLTPNETSIKFAAYSAEFEVVGGQDINNDGTLQANEIATVFPGKIRVLNQSDYTSAHAFLTGGTIASFIFGHAATMLSAFLNDSTPSGATSENAGVLAPGNVTHRVGMKWLENGTANTRRYTWADGSLMSDDVEVNTALLASLRTALNAHAGEVRAYFDQNPSENSHVFTWTYNQPCNFDGLSLYNTFGNVRLLGNVMVTVSRQNYAVTSITYNGSFDDVYDFNMSGGIPAPSAATIQTGFGTIGGNAGRVVRTIVIFANTLTGAAFNYQFPPAP
jgi:hypothetical protein